MKHLQCPPDPAGLRMSRLAILCLSIAFTPGFAFAEDCTAVIKNATDWLRQDKTRQLKALMTSNRADYTELNGNYHPSMVSYSIIYLEPSWMATGEGIVKAVGWGLSTRHVNMVDKQLGGFENNDLLGFQYLNNTNFKPKFTTSTYQERPLSEYPQHISISISFLGMVTISLLNAQPKSFSASCLNNVLYGAPPDELFQGPAPLYTITFNRNIPLGPSYGGWYNQ
jgi:hypothetical protein